MPISRFVRDVWEVFLLHAVAAHFSNGIVPVAILFFVLGLVLGDSGFDRSVLYLLCVVLAAAPVSLVSGIRDWRRNFHGRIAPIFVKKIILSIVLILLCGLAVLVRTSHPGGLQPQNPAFWLYGFSLFLTFPVVFLLGHYGARLAGQSWRNRGKPSAAPTPD